MVWDVTVPSGSDPISQGDDVIRALKTDLETALSHEYSAFPGATPATPIFIPGFSYANTAGRPTGDSLTTGRFNCNTQINVIERYNGGSWDAVATLIPPGTKMLFYQTSAPVGWTAVTLSERFLRVVPAGSTGGTTGGSGLVPSNTITLAHTHTVNSHTHDLANHTHSTPDHAHQIQNLGSATKNLAGTSEIISANSNGSALVTAGASGANTARVHGNQTDTSGAGTSGNPSSNTSGGTAPATDSQLSNVGFTYADVIVATKD